MEKTIKMTGYVHKRETANSASGVVCVALCAACVAVSIFTFCVLSMGI